MGDDIQNIVIDLPTAAPTSWDDFEKLLHHGFYNEVRVAPEEQGLIITESSFADPAAREKITQILFESFNVPGLLVVPTSYLAVACHGTETGLTIHAGETRTEIVPVVDGKVLRDLGVVYPVKAAHITTYIKGALASNGAEVNAAREIEYIKGDFYAALDPTTEGENTKKTSLPDTEIALGDAYWKALEGFLYPEFFSIDHDPLILTILKVIQSCPPETREKLLESIIFSGGTACFKGLKERLTKDFTQLLGNDIKVKVKISDESPKYIPWIGGSILGSLSTVFDKMLTKDGYDEVGPTGIHAFTI